SIAVLGVVVIFMDRMHANVSVRPLIMLFGAATSAGFATVLLKRGPRQPPIAMNATAAVFGCVVCLVASFVTREPHRWPHTAAQIGPILYLTLAGSIVAFVLFAWLVNHWDVTRISFVSVIVPVVAMGLGRLVRHEGLTRANLAGSALVLIGVLLRIH